MKTSKQHFWPAESSVNSLLHINRNDSVHLGLFSSSHYNSSAGWLHRGFEDENDGTVEKNSYIVTFYSLLVKKLHSNVIWHDSRRLDDYHPNETISFIQSNFPLFRHRAKRELTKMRCRGQNSRTTVLHTPKF